MQVRGNLWGSVFSFCHVWFGDRTQVAWLGSKHFTHEPSHWPIISFFSKKLTVLCSDSFPLKWKQNGNYDPWSKCVNTLWVSLLWELDYPVPITVLVDAWEFCPYLLHHYSYAKENAIHIQLWNKSGDQIRVPGEGKHSSEGLCSYF